MNIEAQHRTYADLHEHLDRLDRAADDRKTIRFEGWDRSLSDGIRGWAKRGNRVDAGRR